MKIVKNKYGEQVIEHNENVADIARWIKNYSGMTPEKVHSVLLLGIYGALLDIQDALHDDPARIIKLQKIIQELSDEQG